MALPMFSRQLLRKILPAGSRRRLKTIQAKEFINSKLFHQLSYQEWIELHENAEVNSCSLIRPLISIIVPAYNTPERYLKALIDSVIGQSYPHWQLVLVNASPDSKRAEAIRIALDENKGIAGNTNIGINHAKGDFIAFLDHDDTLAPFALEEIAKALTTDPTIDLFYSDEDKVIDNGEDRSLPFFKPGWSPELFLTANYLAHFVVIRAEIARKCKGIRLGYDGAQDYDFLLRTLEFKPKIHVISRMSYHWRQAVGSTALNLGEKSYASDAGVRALKDYVARHNVDAEAVEIEDRPTEYRLKYRLKKEVTVYITSAAQDWDEQRLKQLKAVTRYNNIQLLPRNHVKIDSNGVVLWLGKDITPLNEDWLIELIALAKQPEIGWVGACMVDQNNNSAGIGYVLSEGQWQSLFNGLNLRDWTHTGPAIWPRNLLAVNPNCAVIEVSKWRKLRTESDIVAGGLEAFRLGLRNVYWPYAQLLSAEKLISIPADGVNIVDPYLNPNLIVRKGLPQLRKQ
jgi:glycosyltransferase involved in cell wall biosynthesis